MILAKCIGKDQIAAFKDDFIKRQLVLKKDGKHIYYPGEITQSHNDQDILSCVPLNLIYDCLGYGLYIAIVECDCNTPDSYHNGTPIKNKIDSSWQKTIKIMNADCKETIDFVFNEVKEPSLISAGYLHLLSEDNRNYFNMKLNSNNVQKRDLDMIIRRMIFDDYEQVEALFQKLHNMHVDAEPDLYKPLDCIHKKRDFKKLVNSKNKILLCAEEKGRIIGISDTKFCTSGMTDIKMAFMDALYVEDVFIGKGVGKKLFYETERIAKENGAKRLDLTVWEFNKDAISFYKTLGMHPQRYTFEKDL